MRPGDFLHGLIHAIAQAVSAALVVKHFEAQRFSVPSIEGILSPRADAVPANRRRTNRSRKPWSHHVAGCSATRTSYVGVLTPVRLEPQTQLVGWVNVGYGIQRSPMGCIISGRFR